MYRFLIVDDNENDALLLTELIEARYADGVQCRVAGTRDKALWWLDPAENEPFDCVLLDLNLPDSQGVETFRTVHRAARPTPIIIYSGRDDERGTIDLLISEGADGYIHKGEAKSKQIYETMRDAAQRARYTARVTHAERRHMRDSEERTERALAHSRRSQPPSDPSRLLIEAFAAHQTLVRDQSVNLAALNGQMEDLRKHVRAAERQAREAEQKARDADASARHSALNLGREQKELRELATANKRKLASLGVAIALMGYALGEGREWIFDVLGSLIR